MGFISGKMLLGGKLIGIEDKKDYFSITNPYTGKIIGSAPSVTETQMDDLFVGIENFQSHLSGEERSNILEKIARRIQEHKQELAEIITAELGICIKQSTYEIGRSYNVFMEAANVALGIDNQDLTSKYRGPDQAKITVVSEPLKSVVGITPFNHPLNQVAHKVAPAIAAGTPIIIKPSEKTPLTALRLGELIEDLIPPYLVNIVTTNNAESLVRKLVQAKTTEGIFFTGGVDVGKKIKQMVAAADHPFKRETYELGGSAPLIILDDADLDLASTLALGAFDNSGQRCTAVRRIIVDNKIAAEFIQRFIGKTREWKYGNPMDPTMDMGTVVNEQSARIIESRVNEAIRDGATLLCGNNRKEAEALYSPTVLDNVTPRMALLMLETFGPVAPIMHADSLKKAVELANHTEYALAGAVVTEDQEKADYVAQKLRLGQFSWNGKPGYRTEQAPFGGRGWSGNFQKEGVIDAAQAMRWIRTQYRHK